MMDEKSEMIPKIKLDYQPLDKKLVHKTKLENVFVANLRKTLPLKISKNIFNKLFLMADDFEKSLLQKNYLDHGQVPDSDFFILTEIPETNMNSYGVLFDFFSKNGMKFGENIFYTEMICNQNHHYYFEHPNDHIPGMMTIEAARQSILACTHIYGNVPLTGYHFILSDIRVSFLNYIELHLPISIKMIQKDCFSLDNIIWSDVIFDVFFFQEKELKAKMTFRNSITTNRVYKRLRNKNLGQAHQL